MVTVSRSAELEEFAREGRRRFKAGDQAWFERTTAHGEVSSFGTADGDVVEAYQAGDAGWIVTHGRFTFEDGSSAANRVITVVVRDPDDGGWKSVLTASQLLVPNELLLAGSPLRAQAGA
jgi:ketosteroid isomerase-like protein